MSYLYTYLAVIFVFRQIIAHIIIIWLIMIVMINKNCRCLCYVILAHMILLKIGYALFPYLVIRINCFELWSKYRGMLSLGTGM